MLLAIWRVSRQGFTIARSTWALGVRFNWTLNAKSDHPNVRHGLFGKDCFKEWSDTLNSWTQTTVVRCGVVGFLLREQVDATQPDQWAA